jgi:D-alanine-D-alanine ligase
MKVAVLKGGSSLEREVSLRSAARVEDALGALGHEALGIDVGADLVDRLREQRPDVVFIALHGPGGEDGTVQELLEILDLPFTGPGVAACALCIDKVAAKHEMRAAGIPTPDWAAFNATAFRELGAADTLEEIEARLGFPLVVKPASQGSSLGVEFASAREEVPQALIAAFSYDDRVLLERYVRGRELAVSVLGGEPLPVVEAIPLAGHGYDFEARYEIGRTSFVCPAQLSDAESAAVTEVALAAYETLGCSGFSRVDLILGEDGPRVLEVNAIPGLTDTSLLPQAAEAAGISFEQLVERILDLAIDGDQSSRSGDAGRLTRGAHTGA